MENFNLKKFLSEGILLKESETLNEVTYNNFKAPVLNVLDEIDEDLFKKLMPRTSQTTDAAMGRIGDFEGGTMFVHFQYFDVKPHGNSPDRPTYRMHNSQYWLNDYQLMMQGKKGQDVNVTLLHLTDITDPENKEDLGAIFVDTKVYLDELKRVFEILNKRS